MLNQTYETNHVSRILCSQHNIGVFTPEICRVYALPTTEQSLKLRCFQMKLTALTIKKEMVQMLETIKAKEREFEELRATYRKTDYQLAELDGRLKKINVHKEAATKRAAKRKSENLKANIAVPGRTELNKALKLMSQSDRDELLKELLR